MVYHDLLKNEVGRAWSAVLMACVLTLWATCGYPTGRRYGGRPGHGPLAFDEYSTVDVVGTAVGFVVAVCLGVRLIARHRLLGGLQRTQDAHFFARAGAPRLIHELLLRVAARDGHVGPDERDVVTRLLTRELPEKVLPQDLKNWSTSLTRARDPVRVARSLALVLTADERKLVLRWCREVAAADAQVDAGESDLLRSLTSVLLEPATVGSERGTR
jgi:uncharacterized tellurite resistance protein B-like protein